MKRWLPAPIVSLALLLTWLVLNGATTGHLLLGAVFALLIPSLLAPLRTVKGPVRRPLQLLRFTALLLWDIVIANFEVARRILGPESRIKPGYVWVPLEIETPLGIAALAAVITMTPGTLSADLSADRRMLLVHCFHLEDAAATATGIKQRYEQPLREIFE
jgi:multicomponent K+:H+ antiporter subunit E